MNQQGQINQLARAADRVRSRMNLVHFLGFLGRSWWMVLSFTFLLLLLAVFLRSEKLVWGCSAVLGLWLAAAAGLMFLRRPSRQRALISLDESGGWKDRFGSAWFFASRPEPAPGEKRHVEKAVGDLPAALSGLDRVFPRPGRFATRGILATVLVLGVLPFLPMPRAEPVPGDVVLTDEMLEEAVRQAAEIRREAEEVDKLEGLDEKEREELKKIRETADGAADELANSDGKTAREVLEALEARAREAEKLARKFGATSDEWASEEMLREMSRHADSADLAAAIKDKNAENAAVESDALAELLDRPELKLETRDRVTTALSQTMGEATEDDLKKPVGERVGNASRKLNAQQPRTAAREFEELAKHFRVVKQRQEAREKLKKMADKLREAGGSVSGSKLQKMEKLANAQSGRSLPKGTQPISQNPLQNQPGVTPMNQGPGQPGNQGQLPIPGLQNPQGQGQQQGQGGSAMPVPGTGQKGKQMGLAGGQPGGKGQKGKGLLAPIPGQVPGAGGAPGASLGGAAGSGAGVNGGLQAGTGTAEIGNRATDPLEANQDAKVTAQVNESGESTFRAVEGQAHREQSKLERQKLAVEFLKVEEEALDGKALPMSRREHVTRYLSTLRKEFEKDGKSR